MKKTIIVELVLVSLFIFGCSRCPSIDIKPLHIVYCEHMGYKIIIDLETNHPLCMFNDYTTCDTDEFYNGSCGSVKTRNLSAALRGECQDVYWELRERCEKGLIASEPKYLLEQPHCIKD